MENLKRVLRSDHRVQPGPSIERNGERANGNLDIPVESWEAYKSWCERVCENWREERNDQTPPRS